MRSGDEPTHARSPLRLRLGLAGFGLLCAIAGVVVFSVLGHPPVAVGFAALGLIALTDLAVVGRHIRQGPHYQPGRDTPPYQPVDAPLEPRPPHHAPPPLATRRRRYLILMAICLSLFVLAWGVVRFYSTTAAVVLTAIAAVIPPIAAIVANAGAGADRSRDEERPPPDVP